MGWPAEELGTDSRQGQEFFSSSQSTDRFCGSPNILSSAYSGFYLRGGSGRDVKLTIHLHVEPRLRMVKLYLPLPIVFIAWCFIN
jgi:hypothetical protein